jgi:hypothetical protein
LIIKYPIIRDSVVEIFYTLPNNKIDRKSNVDIYLRFFSQRLPLFFLLFCQTTRDPLDNKFTNNTQFDRCRLLHPPERRNRLKINRRHLFTFFFSLIFRLYSSFSRLARDPLDDKIPNNTQSTRRNLLHTPTRRNNPKVKRRYFLPIFLSNLPDRQLVHKSLSRTSPTRKIRNFTRIDRPIFIHTTQSFYRAQVIPFHFFLLFFHHRTSPIISHDIDCRSTRIERTRRSKLLFSQKS